MWKSHKHDDEFGPMAAAYRNKGEESSVDMPAPSIKLGKSTNAAVGVPGSSSPKPYPGT
jgi:hypothetical protein